MEQAQPDPDHRCQYCGTALTDETTGGLCPRCLLEMNFASRTMPDGEPLPQIPPPTPEEMAARFPQFEILECLGRGGMGIVYKARQKALDRLVAIKVLAGERHDDPQFEARFEKEARTLAKLSHPNIVTVHDFGESDGMYYLVMEFVDGVNLRDVLRDGRMEPAQALAIVPEICAALQFAHDHGVVHRDIKPENILIDRDGRVKIADFGIAALIGSDADHSGTPPYMAPEQETAAGTIDHRADIYALGVVFYEMLTGERPDKDPTRPSRRVEIDVRLDEIVLRALEKEPARRYQTAGEFRTVVETIRAKAPKETRTEAAGLKDEINSSSPTPPRASTNSSMLPPNRGIVMVGRRGGKAVINWPGVALIFLMILAIVQAGGALFCLALRTPMTSMAMVMGLFGAIMATGIGLGRARSTPLERLVDLDKLHATQANDAAGPPLPPKPAGSHGPFRRLWWLFPASLVLGPLIGAVTGLGLILPKGEDVLHTVNAVFEVKGAEPEIKAAVAQVTSPSTLNVVSRQLDLAHEWNCEMDEVAPRLRQLIHVEPIANTNVIRVKVHQVRRSPQDEAARIAEAIRAALVDQPEGPVISLMGREYEKPSKIESALPVAVGTVLGLVLSPLLAMLVMMSLHRLFPEPQPPWCAAGIAGVLAITLLVTLGIGIKFLHEIRTASLVHVPPGPARMESLSSPEQTARSFMEAIRDGKIDAAMAWMLPEMKQFEKLPLHLELASKILRDEIYAGQLERLTRFADKELTNVDGTTMLMAIRVTPPTGDQAKEVKHGPVLILSSTPDGWRVVHFGEDRAGKSLSDHVKEFQRMNFAIVAAWLAKRQAATADAIIGKWQTADEEIQIEFFPDGTMSIRDGSKTLGGKYSFLDDGRLKTEMLVYGTSVIETIRVAVQGDVMTTIDERGEKQEMTRVPSDDPSPAPPETGKNAPEATTLTDQTEAAGPQQENRAEPSSYSGNLPRIPSAVVSHPQQTNTRFGFIRQSGIFGLLIAYLTVILFFAGAVLIAITRSRKVLKVFFFLAFLPAVAGLCGTYLGNRKIDAHVRGGLDAGSAEGPALVAHGRSVANVTSYLGAGATAALLVAVASGLLITRNPPDKRLSNSPPALPPNNPPGNSQ